MKTITTIFACLLLPLTLLAQPKVRTVDNRANSGAEFTGASALQDAIAAAIPGDTLHIHPSASTYGTLTTTKRLIIVGLSHNPANAKEGEEATVAAVYFQGNSANSLLTGLKYSSINANAVTDVNGIRIINNRGGTITGANANTDDWIIEGNIIEGLVNTNNSEDWMIKNNIISRNNYIIQNFNNTISFLNNIVINGSDNFATGCSDPIVNNNIFILTGSADEIGLNSSTIVFNNNLTYSPNFNPITALSGSNNLDETNPAFTTILAGDYTDYYNNDYHVSGAAVGAATDGFDLGVHGTLAFPGFPFDVQGRPDDFPYMTSLNISNSSVPMGQDINVTFTAGKKN